MRLSGRTPVEWLKSGPAKPRYRLFSLLMLWQYDLDISNITLAPDGTPRYVLAVNGQFPGPTIIADWGDILEITVTNSLTTNGWVL
jgi:FtsP/CotA-like multicopper oxidase with cupredoxin domain